jgi:hypothetical protein
LILQRVADSPDEQPRHIIIYVCVLTAKSGNGHGYGRLHGAQAIRNLPETGGRALNALGRRTSGHRELPSD